MRNLGLLAAGAALALALTACEMQTASEATKEEVAKSPEWKA